MKEGGFRSKTTGRGISASRPVAVSRAPGAKEFSIPMIKVPDMRPGSADSMKSIMNRANAGFAVPKEGPGKPNRFMETTWSAAGKGEVPFDRKFNVQPIKPSITRKGRDIQGNFQSLQSKRPFIHEGPVKPFALRNSRVEHSFGKSNRTMFENGLQGKKAVPDRKVDQGVSGDRVVRNYNPNEFLVEARNNTPEKVNSNSKFVDRRNKTQNRELPKNREVVLFRRRLGDKVNTEKSVEKLNGKARLELLRKLRQERKVQRTNTEQSMNFYNLYKDTFRKGEKMEMRPFIRQYEQRIQPRPNDVTGTALTAEQRLQSIRGELAKIKGVTANNTEIQPKLAMATYWKKDSTQKLNTQLNREQLLAAATKTATRLIELQKKSSQPLAENKATQQTAVKTQVEKGKSKLQQLATKTQLSAKEKMELLKRKKEQLSMKLPRLKEKEQGYTEAKKVTENRINYLVNAVRRQKEDKTKSPVLIPDRQRSFQSRFKIILDGLFPDGSIIRTNNETAGLHNARNLSDLKKKAEDLVKKYPPVKVIENAGEVPRSYVQSVILGKQKEESNKNAITA